MSNPESNEDENPELENQGQDSDDNLSLADTIKTEEEETPIRDLVQSNLDIAESYNREFRSYTVTAEEAVNAIRHLRNNLEYRIGHWSDIGILLGQSNVH